MSWINEATVTTRAQKNGKAKEQARLTAKRERDKALQSITHTWSDGSIVQVRPQDVMNFEVAISRGKDKAWVLADNSIRPGTTVGELNEALSHGISEGERIWEEYIDKLQLLN